MLAVRVLVSSRFLPCLRLQCALLCLCGFKSVSEGVLRVCFGSPCTNEAAKRCSLHASWFMPPFRLTQSHLCIANPHLFDPTRGEKCSASRRRAAPQEVHSNYIRHISLRSRCRRLRAELGSREATVAPSGGGYGISGNRGVSKLTSSARAWPRTRSRRSAGVPSASGLRSISDQWLGPAPAVVVPARAHAMYERNVNRRIFSQAFSAETFCWGT